MTDDATPAPDGVEGLSRGWFIGLGIFFILTGIGALIFPMMVTLSIEILIGTAMLLGGIFAVVHAFKAQQWKGFFLELLFALVYVVGGAFLLLDPLSGMLALTIILGISFLADGIIRTILAFKIKPEKSWWLFLISGALSVILGLYAVFGLTSGSLALLGYMVGFNMLFAGIAFLACTGMAEEQA